MFRSGGVHINKEDSSRYALIKCMEQGFEEGVMFEYTTETGSQCRLPAQDFWALYQKEDVDEDCNNEKVERLHKATESIAAELECIKKENKALEEELEKTKEELEQKKRNLDYSDKYILDLEETRRNNADQIESYKKDLLHVVRSMREGS